MVHIRVIEGEEDIRLRAYFEVAVAPAGRKREGAHAKAVEIARNAPEVDAAKVHRLKEQLKHGTYRVDAGRIADSMLQEVVKHDRAADV